jgi:hypothetical protein
MAWLFGYSSVLGILKTIAPFSLLHSFLARRLRVTFASSIELFAAKSIGHNLLHSLYSHTHLFATALTDLKPRKMAHRNPDSNHKTMSRASRFLLIAMSVSFAIAGLGLVIGLFYDLYVVAIRHGQLENALGKTISYNKVLGGFGILGFLLFFAFILSAIAEKKR